SFKKSLIDARISVDATVAKERPVAPHVLDPRGIYFGEQNLFAIHRTLRDHDSKRIADKRRAPKFDAGSVIGFFVTNSIHRGNVDSVRDRVRPLNSLPRVALRRSVLFFLVGMPTNRGGIEDHVCATKRGQPRAFGIPLVPADQRPDLSGRRVEYSKPEIARREIKLLVVSR